MIHEPIYISQDLKTLTVTSEAFKDGTYIPERYTADGMNLNPPLTVKNIPPDTKSLVLIVEDPDAASGSFTHWIVWNIPYTHSIKEGTIPGIEGINDFGKQHYAGPQPPSGTHRYFFKVYALDDLLELKNTAKSDELEQAMNPHIKGFGEVIGLYKRT